ncbi:MULTISPECIES: ABC transporter ATP-binding protein [Streptococcus]|nr:ATP-binding cassette subfamily B protein [Anaerococcus degeneri]CQH33982.1 ABC transporter ATP-binding protein [Streptococcus agalactiae]
MMLNKVFEYAGSHKKTIHLASFIMLLSVIMGVVPFLFAYQIINPLILGQNLEFKRLVILLAGILICLVLQALLGGLGLNMSHKAAYNTLFGLRTSLQKKMENLPLGAIEEKGTGAIKKMFVDDIGSLEVLLAHSLPEGIANLIVPVMVYIAMFFVDWRLALMSLASIPLSIVAMMIMYSAGMKKMGPYYMASGKMNNTIIEYVNGMEVVKVFNKQAESYQRFSKDVGDYRDYALAWYKTAWPWMALYSALLPCTIILTLPLGGYFAYMGYVSLSDLILVLCLSLSIGLPLLKALGFLPTMPQLNYKISALEDALNIEPLKQGENKFKGIDQTISYDNVTFGYQLSKMGENGQPETYIKNVIHNVSFTAKVGEKTAIVGESGSGKSTLAKLLIHYYDVLEGSISIGGQNLQDMSLKALNKEISYVSQDQYLFNTSLLENIRIGNLSATDEEVIEAAKKAQCMEFLDKLPNGIYSLAGEAGKMLSGGERQRISLARAILKNAPIVVLDEATAYADPENEEKMEAAIAELVKGKTLIVIAHKLPAIVDADQILVMNHGRLVANGKHKDLLESSADYRKLWDATIFSKEWKIDRKAGEMNV